MSFAERESPSSSRRAPSVLHCPIRAVVFIATCPFLTPVAGTRLGLFRDGASSAGAPPATGRSDWELPPAAAPTPTGTFSLSRRCYTPSPQRRMENDLSESFPPSQCIFPANRTFMEAMGSKGAKIRSVVRCCTLHAGSPPHTSC